MKKELLDIYSVKKGIVLYALKTSSDYGYRLYIRHEDGSTAMYAHLSKFYVKEGQEIEGGELVGKMGNTGYSLPGTTEPHLHLSWFLPGTEKLTADYAVDPTIHIMLNHWPTNTKIHNPYKSNRKNPKRPYHEGIDFLTYEIAGWENNSIDPMVQDYLTRENYPELYKR